MMPYRIVRFIEQKIFEWYAALTMLLIGIMMVIFPEAIERGLFRYVLSLWEGGHIMFICLFFSILRIAALCQGCVNWPKWSPRLRVIGAGAGAFLWGQMGASVAAAGIDTNGAPSLSIPVFCMMVLGELVSVWRASRAYA